MIEKQIAAGLKLLHDEDDDGYWLKIVNEDDGSHSLLWLNDCDLPKRYVKANVKWAKERLEEEIR